MLSIFQTFNAFNAFNLSNLFQGLKLWMGSILSIPIEGIDPFQIIGRVTGVIPGYRAIRAPNKRPKGQNKKGRSL